MRRVAHRTPQTHRMPQTSKDFPGLRKSPKNPKRKHTGAAVDFLKNEQVKAAILSQSRFDAAAWAGDISAHIFKKLLPTLCRKLKAVPGLSQMEPCSQPIADIMAAWYQLLESSHNPHITPRQATSQHGATSVPQEQRIPYEEHILERFWSYWSRTYGKEHDWVAMTRDLINSRGRDDGTFPLELIALEKWWVAKNIAHDPLDAVMIALVWTMAHRDGERQPFFLGERDAGRHLMALTSGTFSQASIEQIRVRGRYCLSRLKIIGIVRVTSAGEAGNPRGKATTYEWAWQSRCLDKKPDE